MTFLQNINPMDLEELLAADRALVSAPREMGEKERRMSLAEANWAFLAREVCRLGGITPVSDGERENLRVGGNQYLPFLGQDQFLDAEIMSRKSQELLRPLEQYLQKYLSGATLPREKIHPALKPTWQDIVSGTAVQQNAGRAAAWVGYHTSAGMLGKMEGELGLVYRDIRRNLGLYVKEYGFLALSQVYRGLCVVNGERTRAAGLGEMVRRMRDNYDPRTGRLRVTPDAQHFNRDFRDYEDYLREEDSRGLFGRMIRQAGGREAEMIDQWLARYENLFRAQVVDRYRTALLGPGGMVEKLVLAPLEALLSQVDCFGQVLDTLSRAYEAHGAIWDDYAAFRAATGAGELDQDAFHRRRAELGQYLAGVDVSRFRDDLVDGFFEDPDAWLRVEEELIERMPSRQLRLRDRQMPVEARRRTDGLIRDQILPGDWAQ